MSSWFTFILNKFLFVYFSHFRKPNSTVKAVETIGFYGNGCKIDQYILGLRMIAFAIFLQWYYVEKLKNRTCFRRR